VQDSTEAAPGAAPAVAPEGAGAPAPAAPGRPRLRVLYDERILPALMAERGYANRLAAPRLEKIVLNMGVGEGARDRRKVESAVEELTLIAGQRAVPTLARRSVAGFKLREGQPIGCKATLRRARCYEFLDRLVNIALPRVRDFRGFSSRSFDGRGNFAFGLREQIVFPEIDYDSIGEIRGLDVAIHTSASADEDAKALLRAFDLPFRDLAGGPQTSGTTRTHQPEREAQAPRRPPRRAAPRPQGPAARPLPPPGGALPGRPRPAEDTAQRLPGARAQPMRRHRPLARLPPALRGLAHSPARDGVRRPPPRRPEVVLVRPERGALSP